MIIIGSKKLEGYKMDKKAIIRSLFSGSMRWVNLSFSQEGEDMILDGFLGSKQTGFYIDIGAYHPFCFSNTARFYDKGWHGINIDATPGSMVAFNKWRTRDINLEVALSSNNEELEYYIFEESALNTFDANCLARLEENGYIPIKKVSVKTYTIMQIMDKYLDKEQKIDFMDIDIEGFDEKVIAQIDFCKYRPSIIMIEKREENWKSTILENRGYGLKAFTGRTAIYKDLD